MQFSNENRQNPLNTVVYAYEPLQKAFLAIAAMRNCTNP